MKLTVEILKNLAKQGKVPLVVVEDSTFNSTTSKNTYFLGYAVIGDVNFHLNAKIVLYEDKTLHFSSILTLQNIFEEAYQGFHLEIETLTDNQCIFIIRKNDFESLKISDDYKLATEKMSEVREVRKLVEDARDIQQESATRINDLFKKLEDVKEYSKQLQLKEENAKKVLEQLDNINSDIKELEIRLKKDIPELDKGLDINNFR